MMQTSTPRLILVFGGSFDPPHRAHVQLPMWVREKLGAEEVLYVPAGRAPHKLDREQTDSRHRLAMLRLALQDEPHARIITNEIERAADGRPSYTVDTLEWLKEQLPAEVRLRLLIGTDQLRIFEKWKEPSRVIELAEPVVMLRPPDTPASVLASLPEQERNAWAARLVEVPAMEVSATEIRRRAARGESIEAMVPPPVARYIREHGLYRDELSGGESAG